MGRTRRSAEEIVNKLRQAEVELGMGRAIAEVCKPFSISEPTYRRSKNDSSIAFTPCGQQASSGRNGLMSMSR